MQAEQYKSTFPQDTSPEETRTYLCTIQKKSLLSQGSGLAVLGDSTVAVAVAFAAALAAVPVTAVVRTGEQGGGRTPRVFHAVHEMLLQDRSFRHGTSAAQNHLDRILLHFVKSASPGVTPIKLLEPDLEVVHAHAAEPLKSASRLISWNIDSGRA